MKKIFIVVTALLIVIWLGAASYAAEHGGKEHGGETTPAKEHGGASLKKPSAEQIRNAMKSYVEEKSKATGTFDVKDPQTGKVRKLKLERIHKRVGKTGDYYYSCADFKDTVSGEKLDLDLDVQDKGGVLSVVDVRIHKVNGKERYTYDANDNRIPVPEAKENKDGHGEKEHKHEHGGKEHGGN